MGHTLQRQQTKHFLSSVEAKCLAFPREATLGSCGHLSGHLCLGARLAWPSPSSAPTPLPLSGTKGQSGGGGCALHSPVPGSCGEVSTGWLFLLFYLNPVTIWLCSQGTAGKGKPSFFSKKWDEILLVTNLMPGPGEMTL